MNIYIYKKLIVGKKDRITDLIKSASTGRASHFISLMTCARLGRCSLNNFKTKEHMVIIKWRFPELSTVYVLRLWETQNEVLKKKNRPLEC
jgi:hypothetical protein